MKVQVLFQQLLTLLKSMTPAQKDRPRHKLSQEKPRQKGYYDDFIEYLLNGPVYSDKEIQVIEENQKSIEAWRAKS